MSLDASLPITTLLRESAADPVGWDAFVGRLFRVPEPAISATLGEDWRTTLRIEAWLRAADHPEARSITS